jgi:hypothetical protein
MRNFEKIGLAIVLAVGMAFAGDPLWFAGIEHGQVTFPWIFDCKYGTGSTFDENNTDDPCFKTMGGWWFGYVAGPSVDANADTYGCGNEDTRRSGINKVEANIKNSSGTASFVSFVGPDYSSCEGPDVTDRTNGVSQLPDNFLELKLTIGPGYHDDYAPDIAAFAVNLSTPPNPTASKPTFVKRNIASMTKGLCIRYTSDHDDTKSANGSDGYDVALELGWDESTKTSSEDPVFDTWLSYLPKTVNMTTPKILNLDWTKEPHTKGERYNSSFEGDWEQDNWAETPYPITRATNEMTAIKIRLKGYEATTVNFRLYQIGFFGECDERVPIISAKDAQSSVNFTMNGRVLMAPVNKPAVVQIYNLHGALVQSKTLTPEVREMNLNMLPSGVYMVRAPSLGYTSKIMIK